jgi:hypothetical protein
VDAVDSDSDSDDSVDALDSDADDSVDELDSVVDDSEDSLVSDSDPDDWLDVLDDPVDSFEVAVEDSVERGVWSAGADPPVKASAAPPLNNPAIVTARTASIFFIGSPSSPVDSAHFVSGIPPPTRTLLRLSRHA